MSYTVGDQAVISIKWSDPSSTTPPVDPDTGFTLVNPTTVVLTVEKPDGTRITPAVSVSGFVYSARILLDQPEQWWYGWTASGSYVAHREGGFAVAAARV